MRDKKGRTRVQKEQKANETPERPKKKSIFPNEILDMIWKHAIPHPRDVPEAILVYVNLDLSSPRAILPHPASVIGLHDEIAARRHQVTRHGDERRDWDLSLAKRVFWLLHICPESRMLTRNIFSLDMDDDRKGGAWNTKLWNPKKHDKDKKPDEDMLFLPGLAYEKDEVYFFNWLRGNRISPHPGLKFVRHLALRLDFPLILSLDVISLRARDEHHYDLFDDFLPQWLMNFPSLEKLTLCADPDSICNRWSGRAVLCSPAEGPFSVFGPGEWSELRLQMVTLADHWEPDRWTRSHIKRVMESGLERSLVWLTLDPERPKRPIPRVEVRRIRWTASD